MLLISPSLLKIWFYPNNTFATSFLVFSKQVFVKYPIGMTRSMESVSQYTRGEKNNTVWDERTYHSRIHNLEPTLFGTVIKKRQTWIIVGTWERLHNLEQVQCLQ